MAAQCGIGVAWCGRLVGEGALSWWVTGMEGETLPSSPLPASPRARRRPSRHGGRGRGRVGCRVRHTAAAAGPAGRAGERRRGRRWRRRDGLCCRQLGAWLWRVSGRGTDGYRLACLLPCCRPLPVAPVSESSMDPLLPPTHACLCPRALAGAPAAGSARAAAAATAAAGWRRPRQPPPPRATWRAPRQASTPHHRPSHLRTCNARSACAPCERVWRWSRAVRRCPAVPAAPAAFPTGQRMAGCLCIPCCRDLLIAVFPRVPRGLRAGHNFCAACLSHHLAALLAGGQPLSCPLRCALAGPCPPVCTPVCTPVCPPDCPPVCRRLCTPRCSALHHPPSAMPAACCLLPPLRCLLPAPPSQQTDPPSPAALCPAGAPRRSEW